MKTNLKVIIIIGSIAVIFILTAIFLFNNIFTVSADVVKQCVSPDGKVEAILVEKNGGVTTDFIYALYLVPKGGKYKKGTELFNADNVQNIRIEWTKNKLLQISYDKARIFHFSNFWHTGELDNFKYIVELQLKNN